MGTYIGPPVFNSGARGDTFPLNQHLSCYRRVTSKGYPTLDTYTTLQYHFYYATCPHRCIHESLLVLCQLGNYYGRYTVLVHLIILPTLLTGLRGRALGALGRVCFMGAGTCDTLKQGVWAWGTLRVACRGGTCVVPGGVNASTPAAAGCVGTA